MIALIVGEEHSDWDRKRGIKRDIAYFAEVFIVITGIPAVKKRNVVFIQIHDGFFIDSIFILNNQKTRSRTGQTQTQPSRIFTPA